MNTFDGLINRVDTAEERINELEYKWIAISQAEKWIHLKKIIKKAEQNI